MKITHPTHLEDLRRSGLSDETIRAARIYTVPPRDIGKKLGGGDSGIESLLAFPYPDCEGYERYRVWYQEGKIGPKYKQRYGTGNHLYLAPTIDLQGDSPLLVVEGEKKTLALRQAGFQVVGLGGVWNWCERAEGYKRPKEPRPIPDLDLVNWRRPVNILFDSDGHDNRNVRLAAFRLAREFAKRGAAVFILFLPTGENGEKVGADDYLVAYSPEALADLLKTAWPFDPALSDEEVEISYLTKDLTPQTPLSEKLECLVALPPCLSHMSEFRRIAVQESLRERLALPAKYLSALNKDILKSAKAQRKKAKENSQQEVYTALLDGLVDLVEHEGKPVFLIMENGKLKGIPQVEIEGVAHLPPPKEQIPWMLARGGEVVKAYAQAEPPGILYDDLLNYFQSISELPAQAYYDLLTAWTFHTYLMEKHQYSPIICNFAVPERGKSRTGKGMVNVAFRGIHVESLRDAYLVRIARNYQATIFFDTMNIWKKAEKAGSEDILLLRFERGAQVPRVLYPEKGAHKDTVYFKVFGPTIIATNISVHNILDTRAIQINMPQSHRRFENEITPELALPLKERLTAFRARFMDKPLPACDKPARGRLGDILKPLIQIIKLVKPDREALFLSLVRDLEKERLIDKSDSLDAQILLVLDSLRNQVERGILPVKAITESFNEGKAENAQFSFQRMGRKLASLGFKKGKTGDGASAILWDDEKLARIFTAYGLGETSEIPETSETPDQGPDVSDHSDISDVCSMASEEKKSPSFSLEGEL
jgi:hypothetical protein